MSHLTYADRHRRALPPSLATRATLRAILGAVYTAAALVALYAAAALTYALAP